MVLRASDPYTVTVLGRRGGVAGAFNRLRETAKEHLSLGPDRRVNEVLQGVVMGDTVGIDNGWLEAFRRSGTAHMLSVSGLHVASLAAIMIGLARLLRAPRWVGFALAAGLAVLMVPFVGPSPPITRSAVMIVVVLLGRWVGRGRDQWQVLALAAVVILAMNPFAVFDVGFQLSFAAFVGMMALAAPLQKLLRCLPKVIAADIAVSLAAGAGTAPVALLQFGKDLAHLASRQSVGGAYTARGHGAGDGERLCRVCVARTERSSGHPGLAAHDVDRSGVQAHGLVARAGQGGSGEALAAVAGGAVLLRPRWPCADAWLECRSVCHCRCSGAL